MGEGSGRGSDRVGPDLLSAITGRVGSSQRFAGSGRVQEKWPVDNSDIDWWFWNKIHLELYSNSIDRKNRNKKRTLFIKPNVADKNRKNLIVIFHFISN